MKTIITKFKVEKNTENGWEPQDDLGYFDSVELANERVYMILENKSEVWNYKITSFET
jgi:hypothetical protein